MANQIGAFLFSCAALVALAGCNTAPGSAPSQQGGTYFILEVDAAALEQDQLESAADQATDIIRQRVNPTGESNIEVTRQPDHRILIRVPGAEDTDAIRRRMVIIGHLTFNLLDETSPEEMTADQLPPDTMLAPPYPGIGGSAVVVERTPRLTGARLAEAAPSTDPSTNEFVLTFRFDAEGTQTFCQITRDHVGERFAVLLDNQVLTAPRINEPICGGSGQITGGFTEQSATDLAAVLRAGALPAPLNFIEEGVYTDGD